MIIFLLIVIIGLLLPFWITGPILAVIAFSGVVAMIQMAFEKDKKASDYRTTDEPLEASDEDFKPYGSRV